MSILSALKETQRDNNNLEDLAKLPQALIMQMAQNGQIPKDMVMPILGKKAEMAESTAKMNAAKQIAAQGGAQPTIMEQYMGQIAQAENPAPPMPQQQMQQPMPQQMFQQQMAQAPMPQGPEDVGIATQATAPMQMAGGGIVAFDDGGEIEVDPEDDYQDLIDQAEEDSMNEEMYDLINQMKEHGGRGERAAVGIRSGENKNIKEGIREKATKHTTDEDQARKHNVGNLRPSGFTYPGQIGLSKGKFAMFDSPESGLNALHHDIGIKLNRGLDTPSKFISVYAPASDNNDVKAYSGNVAKMLGIGPNDRIPNTSEAKQILANAIIRQEGAHKATAAFAQGGIASIPKFSGVGPSLIDIDGNPLRSSPSVPRSTTTFYPDYLLNEEYGYPNERERLLDEEYRKGKPASSSKTSKTSRSTDKVYTAAEKAIEEQKLRRASMSQPKVKGGIPSPGIGTLRGTSIPLLAMSGASSVYQGLSGPDQVNIPTEADVNPGDLTAAEIEAAKRPALIYPKIRGKRYTSDLPVVRGQEPTKQQQQPTSQKEGFVDPNIERLKQMDVYGNTKQKDAPAAPAQQKAEEETFNLMQYARQQQADRKKAAEMDKWQAGLAAGLGMLGGTSQYAMENIGKGGQMGVQQLANSQRLRASQDIADNKLLGTAYNANMVNKYRNDLLGQNKELRQDKLSQDLIIARQAHVDRTIKERGMDMTMMHNLEREKAVAAAEGKTFDTKKQATLDYYRNMNKKIQDEAMKMYPSQLSGSGYSARRIGQ